MPLYEYRCEECGKEVELLQSRDEEPPCCCGEVMKRLISKSSFRLVGSGWAKDGYSKETRDGKQSS